MTVDIVGDNICICDTHIEQNPKNELITFDTFQAYYVTPTKVGLVDIAMRCHGYVTCLLLLCHTPVATVNPGPSCVPVSSGPIVGGGEADSSEDIYCCCVTHL